MTSSDDGQIVVIGAGQAGLSMGYHLRQRGLPFVILDANPEIGDSWRNRWDSLRLFTPARYDGLDGMPFPAPPQYFPTKEEMADYLEAYAEQFDLPVLHETRVESLERNDGRFLIRAGKRHFEADQVVVAMSGWQRPRIPAWADDLRPDILQIHSADYRNPGQLRDGSVLVVGAGNSGAEIALDVADGRRVLLAGPDTGHVPFRVEGRIGRVMVPVVLRLLFHRVLTVNTPMGRRKRPKMVAHGEALVRVKPGDLLDAGVERVGRVIGVSEGRPLLDDDLVVDPSNVIWCTGFEPGLDWIRLPVFNGGYPDHHAGVVPDEPGLYFVGLKFLFSVSSAQVHGVGRDAARIADAIVTDRENARLPSLSEAPA